MGIPIDPKATGEVFAIKQSDAPSNRAKPKPANMAAATATGAPNPAAPYKSPERKCDKLETLVVRSITSHFPSHSKLP